jgi:hypothetical protein
MAEIERRSPEQFSPQHDEDLDFTVSELAADTAGSLSPFGTELEFPLPLDKIRYTHPGPEERPRLAGGR